MDKIETKELTNLQRAWNIGYKQMLEDKKDDVKIKSPLMYAFNGVLIIVEEAITKLLSKRTSKEGVATLKATDVVKLYKVINDLKV